MEQLLNIKLKEFLGNNSLSYSNIYSLSNQLLNVIRTKKHNYTTNDSISELLINVFHYFIFEKYHITVNNLDSLIDSDTEDSKPIIEPYVKLDSNDEELLNKLYVIIPDIVETLYKPRSSCFCKLIF